MHAEERFHGLDSDVGLVRAPGNQGFQGRASLRSFGVIPRYPVLTKHKGYVAVLEDQRHSLTCNVGVDELSGYGPPCLHGEDPVEADGVGPGADLGNPTSNHPGVEAGDEGERNAQIRQLSEYPERARRQHAVRAEKRAVDVAGDQTEIWARVCHITA